MDVIVHAAGALKGSKAFVKDCFVNGTRNVADAAQRKQVKRVIYVSSLSVYEYLHAKNGSLLNEESELETQSEKRGIYSWAKRQAEDIALCNLSDDEPAWTILRPSLIFGNRRDLVSLVGPKVGNFVISFGRKGKHLKLVHVKDVARAIILTIENNCTRNRVFNVSHDDEITVNNIVQECFRQIYSKRLYVVYVSYPVCILGMIVLKIIKVFFNRGPSISRVRLAYQCRDLLLNSKAFHDATGWRPGDALLSQLIAEARSV